MHIASLQGGVKEDIHSLEQKLVKVPKKEKSKLHCDLAILYLKDQEQDKAFESFLLALDNYPQITEYKPLEEENKLLQEALNFYFNSGLDPVALGTELLKKYEKIADSHPHFRHFNALLATAYANCGMLERFFNQFYTSYCPDYFLAPKTKGILTLRLSSHAKTEEERKNGKALALKYMLSALEMNPQDPSLYRLVLVLAHENNDKELKVNCLKNIAHNKVTIPRADIFYYVKECVEMGRKDLGQELLNCAKEKYEYSRAISAAEEVLKNAR